MQNADETALWKHFSDMDSTLDIPRKNKLFSKSMAACVPKNLSKLSIGRLNHIAIAVPDLKAASEQWSGIYSTTVSEPVEQPEHGVYTVFIELPNTKIELIHPLGDNSPISKFLEKSNYCTLTFIFNIKLFIFILNQNVYYTCNNTQYNLY